MNEIPPNKKRNREQIVNDVVGVVSTVVFTLLQLSPSGFVGFDDNKPKRFSPGFLSAN